MCVYGLGSDFSVGVAAEAVAVVVGLSKKSNVKHCNRHFSEILISTDEKRVTENKVKYRSTRKRQQS